MALLPTAGAVGRNAAPSVRIAITDTAGRPVRHARLGQVLRFTAVSTDGSRPRVCVDRVDRPYCSSPLAPTTLVRLVRPRLVVGGRVTVRAIAFPGHTVGVRSIPVAGTP